MAGCRLAGRMVTARSSAVPPPPPGRGRRREGPVPDPCYPLLLLLLLLLAAFPGATSAYNTTFVQQDIDGECWQHVSHQGGKIFSHPGHGRYADNTDCKVTVTAEPGMHIRAVFESFDVTDSVNCYQDEVIVYDGEQFSNLMLSGAPYGLCGANLAPRYRQIDTSGNALTVRFITDNVVSANKGFSLVFTSYVPEEVKAASDTCFACRDDTICIHSSLACDSLWNCADGSDESFELCSVVPTKELPVTTGLVGWMGTFLAITVATFVLLFIAISLVVCCCCRGNCRGRPGIAGAPGVSSPGASSDGSSSSDGAKNAGPSYGQGSGLRQGRGTERPPYRQDPAGREMESHVFYGYPPPSVGGREPGEMYRVQCGYYPLKKDARGHSMEHLYGGSLAGNSVITMPTHH